MAETEEVFEVEQILARRQVESDQTEYLVRWRGFESDQDSWEPLDRLGRAAHHIVAQFNERSHRHPQQHLNASFGKHIQGKQSGRMTTRQGTMQSELIAPHDTLVEGATGLHNHSPGHHSRKSSISLSPGECPSPRRPVGSPERGSQITTGRILRRSSQDLTSTDMFIRMNTPLLLDLEPAQTAGRERDLLDKASQQRILPARSCKRIGTLDTSVAGVSDVTNPESPPARTSVHGEVRNVQSSLDIITGFDEMPAPLTPSPSVKSPRTSPRGTHLISEEDMDINGCEQSFTPAALTSQGQKVVVCDLQEKMEGDGTSSSTKESRESHVRRGWSLPGLPGVAGSPLSGGPEREQGRGRTATNSHRGTVPEIEVEVMTSPASTGGPPRLDSSQVRSVMLTGGRATRRRSEQSPEGYREAPGVPRVVQRGARISMRSTDTSRGDLRKTGQGRPGSPVSGQGRPGSPVSGQGRPGSLVSDQGLQRSSMTSHGHQGSSVTSPTRQGRRKAARAFRSAEGLEDQTVLTTSKGRGRGSLPEGVWAVTTAGQSGTPNPVTEHQGEEQVKCLVDKLAPSTKKRKLEEFCDSVVTSPKKKRTETVTVLKQSPRGTAGMSSRQSPLKGQGTDSSRIVDHNSSAINITLSQENSGARSGQISPQKKRGSTLRSDLTSPVQSVTMSNEQSVTAKSNNINDVLKRERNVSLSGLKPNELATPDLGDDKSNLILTLSPEKVKGSKSPPIKAGPQKSPIKSPEKIKNSPKRTTKRTQGTKTEGRGKTKSLPKSPVKGSPSKNIKSTPDKKNVPRKSLQHFSGNAASRTRSPEKSPPKSAFQNQGSASPVSVSKAETKPKGRDGPRAKSIPLTVSMAKKLKSAAQKRVQLKIPAITKGEKESSKTRSPRTPRKSPRIILKDVIQLSKMEFENSRSTSTAKKLVLSLGSCDSVVRQVGQKHFQILKHDQLLKSEVTSNFKVAKKMAEQVPAKLVLGGKKKSGPKLSNQQTGSQSSISKKMQKTKDSPDIQTSMLKKGKRPGNAAAAKEYSKLRKKMNKPPITPDMSDDDILYSLNPDYEGSSTSKPPKSCADHEVESIMKTLEPGSPGTSSPATSPRKLLLKDSINPKNKVVKPVARSSTLPASPAKAASATQLLDSGPCKTPPGSPMHSSISCHQGETTPRDNTYVSDLPAIPVIPFFPSSPSTASYKNLLKNLQANRGSKRGGKNSDSGEDDELVERRVSVRHSESAFRYKEIIVKKCPGYTQMWLFTTTKMKNALNPKVFQELTQALHNAKFDDSRLVLLSGSGSVFCSGIDLNFLLTGDRRQNARIMADAIRDFVNVMIAFPKPVVAAVNGPATGLGVALLPLCDIIYASDKASFYCPFSRLSQTPEGCSSLTFPQVMGLAMANEMLLGGRKLTAIEAYQIGLVSQVFWPTSMMQEVVPRIQNIATNSAKSLEASKFLMRSHQRGKMELTIESECRMLSERWASSECQKAIRAYLDEEQDFLL